MVCRGCCFEVGLKFCFRFWLEVKLSSRGRSWREVFEVGFSVFFVIKVVVVVSSRGFCSVEGCGGKRIRVFNREEVVVLVVGVFGYSWVGYFKFRVSKEIWGWGIWVRIMRMRFRV